jgi:hypothetical protein
MDRTEPIKEDYMPFHHNNQRSTDNGFFIDDTGSGAERAVMRAVGSVRVYYTGGKWYKQIDGTSTEITVEYVPTFAVRAICLKNAAQVHFDMPASENVVDTFASGVLHPVQVTKLYLDVNTTVTSINFYA